MSGAKALIRSVIGSCFVAVLVCLLAPVGCDESDIAGPEPHVPFVPTDPTPHDGSDEMPPSLTLSWSGFDPDGDDLTFDVYFGDTRSPQLVAQALYEEHYYVSSLERQKSYTWRVVAFDPDGNSTRSPLWSFETSPQASDYVFPLALHNRWDYVTENRITVSYSDNSAPPVSNIIPGLATILVSQRDYWPVGANECYRMDVTLDFDGQTYQRVQLCGNEPRGLMIYDSWGTHDFGLMPSRDESHETNDPLRAMDRKTENSLALTYPSERMSLAYPLEVGSKWTVYTEPDGRWHNEKEVTSLVTRTVPAGTFQCFEIRWHILVDAEGESLSNLDWTDYIAREGLIERIIRTRSIEPNHNMVRTRIVETVAQYRLREFELR